MADAVLLLVDACSAHASGDASALAEALSVAARECSATEVEEVLLQSHLFLGYPAALRGLTVWRQVSGTAAPPAATRDEAEWEARGVATFRRVYGDQSERLRANARLLHPDLERWMVTEGYGKVLGRPALDLGTRELCIVALLAWQDAAPQLYSHLRGALNVGVPDARVNEVVERLAARLDGTRRETLRLQWDAVRVRRTGNE